MITIIFIVNGVDIRVEEDENQSLWIFRDIALTESNNVGRPLYEWEVRNEYGVTLDTTKTPAKLSMNDADRVFLNLQVGIGG